MTQSLNELEHGQKQGLHCTGNAKCEEKEQQRYKIVTWNVNMIMVSNNNLR